MFPQWSHLPAAAKRHARGESGPARPRTPRNGPSGSGSPRSCRVARADRGRLGGTDGGRGTGTHRRHDQRDGRLQGQLPPLTVRTVAGGTLCAVGRLRGQGERDGHGPVGAGPTRPRSGPPTLPSRHTGSIQAYADAAAPLTETAVARGCRPHPSRRRAGVLRPHEGPSPATGHRRPPPRARRGSAPARGRCGLLPVPYRRAQLQAPMPCSAASLLAVAICSDFVARSARAAYLRPPAAFQLDRVNCRPP